MVTACGAGSTGVTAGKKVALLLPGTSARYEATDRPAFSDKAAPALLRLPGSIQRAAKNGADQEAQAKAAITGGASVIVVDPVDTTAAAAIIAEAKAGEHPRHLI